MSGSRYISFISFILLIIFLSGCASAPEAPDVTVPAESTADLPSPTDAVTTSPATDAVSTAADDGLTAVYLGVDGYGLPGVDRDNRDSFRYRFDVGGDVMTFAVDNGERNESGNYAYPLQNILKVGYEYRLKAEDGTVTAVSEIPETGPDLSEPAVSGVPGEKTLRNFLMTALEPVGSTLYIYGGGWDWQDEGPSVQSRTTGISPCWARFFKEHDQDYTYKDRLGSNEAPDPSSSYYPYGGYNQYYFAGLDCSGYLGWAIYNTLNTESGSEGYVMTSTGFAKNLSDRGWGEWTDSLPADGVLRPGDVVSTPGHVWISLGTCMDGSVILLQSSPTQSRKGQPGGGVQISAVGTDGSCEAYKIADRYMSKYYPEWYERYPVKLCRPDKYYDFGAPEAGVFTWTTDGGSGCLTDPDGIGDMVPEAVLALLFGE